MYSNMSKKPAIILTTQRTGGTFLAMCLSNHPDIFCARGEPLSPRSFWVDAAPDPVERLHVILHQQYYDVSMCKLVDSHAFGQPGVWDYITENDVRIVYLKRENVLAQAVSHEINAARSRGEITSHPTHAFVGVNPPPVEIDPDAVLRRCNSEAARYLVLEDALSECDLDVLRLTYEQITGGGGEASEIPGDAAARICDFLEVDHKPLHTKMRKVHKAPLSETVANWPQIVRRLHGTQWEAYIEGA